MIEQQIEACVLAKIQSLATWPAGTVFDGAWQAAAAGEVKGEEAAGTAVKIAVATGAVMWADYTIPSGEIPVAIAVTVRRDLCPDGSALSDVLSPIMAKLVAWQLDADLCSTDLSVSSAAVVGFRLDAGDPPSYDSARKSWAVVRSFTLKIVPTN